MRRPLYGPGSFLADYGRLLDNIAAAGNPVVIAISPLPCVDPMHMHYRLRGAGLVRQAAESRGMLYLDGAQALGGPRASRTHGLHCHVLHLGREGQRLLGEAVARMVESPLSLASGEVNSALGVSADFE